MILDANVIDFTARCPGCGEDATWTQDSHVEYYEDNSVYPWQTVRHSRRVNAIDINCDCEVTA